MRFYNNSLFIISPSAVDFGVTDDNDDDGATNDTLLRTG